jgi:sortase A
MKSPSAERAVPLRLVGSQTRLGAISVALAAASAVAAFAVAGGTGTAGAVVPPSTLPPTDTALPSGETLPELPVPSSPPLDNELEPQQYYGRIVIPKIDVDSPLLEGIRLSTLDYGPGHWPGTAMPGELGNTVFAGHRTSHNADFRRLDELAAGDEIIFDLDNSDGIPTATVAPEDPFGGVYVYHVTSVFRVPPSGMWVVSQHYRHEATLFACHPPGSVAERIIVQADLVSINGEPAPDPPDQPRVEPTQTTILEA